MHRYRRVQRRSVQRERHRRQGPGGLQAEDGLCRRIPRSTRVGRRHRRTPHRGTVRHPRSLRQGKG